MPDGADQLLLLAFGTACWLFAKHFVCDFVLQTPWQTRHKGQYGHPGGLVHAGVHGLGSAPLIVVAPTAPELVAAIVASEVVLHYHIDWAKQTIVARAGWTPEDQAFWNAIGADQMLHHATYLAMTAGIVFLAVGDSP